MDKKPLVPDYPVRKIQHSHATSFQTEPSTMYSFNLDEKPSEMTSFSRDENVTLDGVGDHHLILAHTNPPSPI